MSVCSSTAPGNKILALESVVKIVREPLVHLTLASWPCLLHFCYNKRSSHRSIIGDAENYHIMDFFKRDRGVLTRRDSLGEFGKGSFSKLATKRAKQNTDRNGRSILGSVHSIYE